MSKDKLSIIQSNAGLAADVRHMIGQTRGNVARTVSAGMTLLYWRIGKRIQMEVLQHERAEYGGRIVATLSQELSAEFGRGYSYSALTRMVKFAEVFSEGEIVATLSQQLSWSASRIQNHPVKVIESSEIVRTDPLGAGKTLPGDEQIKINGPVTDPVTGPVTDPVTDPVDRLTE